MMAIELGDESSEGDEDPKMNDRFTAILNGATGMVFGRKLAGALVGPAFLTLLFNGQARGESLGCPRPRPRPGWGCA